MEIGTSANSYKKQKRWQLGGNTKQPNEGNYPPKIVKYHIKHKIYTMKVIVLTSIKRESRIK